MRWQKKRFNNLLQQNVKYTVILLQNIDKYSLKVNELNHSSQAGVIFFNSTPAKNTNF